MAEEMCVCHQLGDSAVVIPSLIMCSMLIWLKGLVTGCCEVQAGQDDDG